MEINPPCGFGSKGAHKSPLARTVTDTQPHRWITTCAHHQAVDMPGGRALSATTHQPPSPVFGVPDTQGLPENRAGGI